MSAPKLNLPATAAGMALGLAVGGAIVWAGSEHGPLATQTSTDQGAADSHFELGLRSLREGDAKQAETHLKRCIELSDSTPCHRILGSLLAMEGRASAKDHLLKAAASSTIAEDRAELEAALKVPERP